MGNFEAETEYQPTWICFMHKFFPSINEDSYKKLIIQYSKMEKYTTFIDTVHINNSKLIYIRNITPANVTMLDVWWKLIIKSFTQLEKELTNGKSTSEQKQLKKKKKKKFNTTKISVQKSNQLNRAFWNFYVLFLI